MRLTRHTFWARLLLSTKRNAWRHTDAGKPPTIAGASAVIGAFILLNQ
jgi:hypothetical protein